MAEPRPGPLALVRPVRGGSGAATPWPSLPVALRGSQWVLGSQILTSAASLVTTVLLVRGIGLEAFGQFSLCFLLLMFLRNFFNGAVLAPTATLAPRLRQGSAAVFRGFLASVTLGFCALAGVSAALLMVVLTPVLGAPWLPALIPPLLVASVAGSFADLVSRYHLVHSRPSRSFRTEAARYGVQMALLVLLLVTSRATPASALLALAAGSLAGVLVGLAGVARLGWSRRLSRALWPRYRTFMRWMSMANVVETVQTLVPMLVGLAILGEAALGMLRAVAQIANVLNLPANALQQFLPAAGTRVFRAEGDRALIRFLSSVTGWIMGYFALAAGVLFLLSSLINQVLFAEAHPLFLPVLMVFIAGNLFTSIRVVFSAFFVCKETPKAIFVAQGVSAVVAVTLSFFAAGFGTVAIPVAVATSTFVGMAICLFLARRALAHG